MNDLINIFGVGGPIVGATFIVAIIAKILADRRKGKHQAPKIDAEYESAIVQATREVVNMVRSELDAAITKQIRISKENEKLELMNHKLTTENEELQRQLNNLKRLLYQTKSR